MSRETWNTKSRADIEGLSCLQHAKQASACKLTREKSKKPSGGHLMQNLESSPSINMSNIPVSQQPPPPLPRRKKESHENGAPQLPLRKPTGTYTSNTQLLNLLQYPPTTQINTKTHPIDISQPQAPPVTAPPAPTPPHHFNPNPNSNPNPAPQPKPSTMVEANGSNTPMGDLSGLSGTQVRPGGAPARVYLNEKIVPHLLEGMKSVAREQ